MKFSSKNDFFFIHIHINNSNNIDAILHLILMKHKSANMHKQLQFPVSSKHLSKMNIIKFASKLFMYLQTQKSFEFHHLFNIPICSIQIYNTKL